MNETPKQRLGKWLEEAIVEKVQLGGIGYISSLPHNSLISLNSVFV